MTNHIDDKEQLPTKQPEKKSTEQPKSSSQKAIISQASFTKGPIPPPDLLSSYDKVKPGLANRIVIMAEEEAIHRRYLQKRSLNAEILETTLGQFFGFGIGAITIGGGVIASIYGSPLVGASISTIGVIGLVSVFIYGRKENSSP